MEVHLLNYMNENVTEAGCDEAGRGPLAGPVFAAAVILPHDFHHPLLNDSKKMTEKARDILRPIIEKEAVSWAVAQVSAEDIDRINILNASIAGMWKAVCNLALRPEHLLVDGNRFKPYRLTGDGQIPDAKIKESENIPYDCIVKGDGKFAPIAAASVLAKTYRDEYMRQIAKDFPEYGWKRNMGYPTAEHIEAVRRFGLTPHHRKSFHVKELEPRLF